MNINGEKNNLAKSSSPYLLQHAHNPVHWQPWNDATLALAKAQNKPLLVSIGYSACHWCHVMAHETFEDEATARIMNEQFMCIKVDREEQPDIDAVYMQAVQLMTGSGGWPLHVFALPDGRPFFGGTYFPKDQWQKLCRAASHEFRHNREKLEAYAQNLEYGMRIRVPVISSMEIVQFDRALVHDAARNLVDRFDHEHGGFLGAPKFPMPTMLNFLHDFSLLADERKINEHIRYTLEKISLGGIYDHIGGGFARYAVDSRWKVPHFEKMLYDNAQLLSLLSKLQRSRHCSLFTDRIRETADFLLRDLKTSNGLFASSLDADSEGVEGKFYVWRDEEIREILGDLGPIAKAVFSIDDYGYWENGTYILQMKEEIKPLAEELGVPEKKLREDIDQIKTRLYHHRKKRISPHLDNKALASWNALAIQGLAHSAMALHTEKYVTAAQAAADFILEQMRMEDGGLFHVYKSGQAYIPGFLEDYSHLISALITLYKADLDEKWLFEAKSLMHYVYDHFWDAESGFFYFTTVGHSNPIKRDIDLTDGVIPSANSVLAHALTTLSQYFEISIWEEHARKMAANMADEFAHHPGSYSNWASLYQRLAYPSTEISIAGKSAHKVKGKLQAQYRPNHLYAGTISKSALPILRNRSGGKGTAIFICQDKVCGEPITSAAAALQELQEHST